MAAVASALALAAPASATAPTVTVAPIGPQALFVTVTNPGPETITGYLVTPPSEPYAVNIVTGQVCQFQPWIGTTRSCNITVAPATSAQICFAGSSPELYPGLSMLVGPAGSLVGASRIQASTSSVAPPCTFPPGVGSGSTPGTSGTPGSGSGGGSSATPVTPSKAAPSKGAPSKGAHSWSRARCKSTYKAWTKKHRKATRRQKKAEASTLHRAHGCPLSILK